MESTRPVIISLCDLTCEALKPWLETGDYDCYAVDLQHPPGVTRPQPNLTLIGAKVEKAEHLLPKSNVRACFAFPPCTSLCCSGSQYWEKKGPKALKIALRTVHACRKIAKRRTKRWYIENPVGRLSTHWRKPNYIFQPCQYARYIKDPEKAAKEAYNKRTCIWSGSGFVMPSPRALEPVLGSITLKWGGKSLKTKNARSKTPRGWSNAVYAANRLPECAFY